MNNNTAWLLIYATLVGIENHPRNEAVRSREDLAAMADHYIEEYFRRFPCQSSPQD